MRRFFLLFILMLNLFIIDKIEAQQIQTLTYEDAINIALKRSYTIKSYLENKIAMQQFFNYNRAQFKPKMELNIFTPSWNENVIPVQLPDGLPVYNSFGSIQFGGNLQFIYILPTGGNVALSSLMYRDDIKTILALQNYYQLKTSQAYSSLSVSFNQPIFTRNTLRENLNEARYRYEQSSSQFTRGQMNIIYNVTRGFYRLYRATREVEINREKLKNSEEAYRIAKLKGETGRIPEGDVLIAEVAAAQNRANQSESIGNLEREKDNFKQLIGLELNNEIQIITDLQYDTFKIDLSKAIEEASKNRLEIYEADLDIKLQKIELDKAERVRELSYEVAKVTVIREVRDVVRSVEEAKNRLKINEKNQEVAQRSYEISRMRFENGDITSQELGVEQERLATTQLNYLDAFITYQLAVADLKRKTLWDFQNNQSYLKDEYLSET